LIDLDVADALFSRGELRREQIPAVAMALLEAGRDTPSLRVLAGLGAAQMDDAHDLFRKMLVEMGRRTPTLDEAAVTVATSTEPDAAQRSPE